MDWGRFAELMLPPARVSSTVCIICFFHELDGSSSTACELLDDFFDSLLGSGACNVFGFFGGFDPSQDSG